MLDSHHYTSPCSQSIEKILGSSFPHPTRDLIHLLHHRLHLLTVAPQDALPRAQFSLMPLRQLMRSILIVHQHSSQHVYPIPCLRPAPLASSRLTLMFLALRTFHSSLILKMKRPLLEILAQVLVQTRVEKSSSHTQVSSVVLVGQVL